MHGGEYGSFGICVARSEQGVTVPSGAAATLSPPAPAPAAPWRPGRVTCPTAAGPLGRVVAGPPSAAAEPDAAPPGAAGPPSPAAAVCAPAAASLPAPPPVPTVSCSRRAGTVSALTARNAV